jgi:hypothetical protein
VQIWITTLQTPDRIRHSGKKIGSGSGRIREFYKRAPVTASGIEQKRVENIVLKKQKNEVLTRYDTGISKGTVCSTDPSPAVQSKHSSFFSIHRLGS